MNDIASYYTELIIRYLSGEATPEEIGRLKEWIEENPANREEFIALKKTEMLLEKARLERSADPEQEWRLLKEKIRPAVSVKNTRTAFLSPWLFRAAAALIVLAIPIFLLLRYANRPEMISVTASDHTTEIKLPDGTSVALKRGARIDYPEKFTGKIRQVTLQGEAWFEVVRDEKRPFTVESGKTLVEVLGTTFSLDSGSPEEETEVILISGKVKVALAGNAGPPVLLSPGEMASVNERTAVITHVHQTDPNLLAWKTGHIVLDNTPLSDALRLLSEVYGVSFVIQDPALEACRITATFDRQSLDAVLNVIKVTLGLEIEHQGEVYRISGNGC